MKNDFVFSSESVTEGDPDKLCDQISDALVDRFLQHDPLARIVAEAAVTNSILFVAARFASTASVDIASVAREVLCLAGYNQGALNSKSCSIITSMQQLEPREVPPQAPLPFSEIDRFPADDQVTVCGFACNQTAAFMPLPIWLAHRLARRLTSVRLQKILPYLAPDGKSRVAVEYRNRKPSRIQSLTLIAGRHEPGAPDQGRMRRDLREAVIEQVFCDEAVTPDDRTEILISPDAPCQTEGPALRFGSTGRKSAVDLYGGYSRQSDAALSGKDPLRIDRLGAYVARYAAKNVVAAGLADECEVLLSYRMGQARPVSLQVETSGTGRVSDTLLAQMLERQFELRPAGIVQQFNLRRLPMLVKGGFYRKLAAYGQVGRMDIGLPWEVIDKTALLRDEMKK